MIMTMIVIMNMSIIMIMIPSRLNGKVPMSCIILARVQR